MQSRIAPSRRLLQSLSFDKPTYLCKRCRSISQARWLTQPSSRPAAKAQDETQPVRERIKDDIRVNKLSQKTPKKTSKAKDALLAKWELTVGVEIHAELNTECKLFSAAKTSLGSIPNAHSDPFDVAAPGSQPHFQRETLLPAVRAALALGCNIQDTSTWDRKHYFWWDQPNGYQITQYNAPFAKAGQLTLYTHDDIDPTDQPSITIGIKQLQMEQDTAKTVLQPPSTYMLDFNRASHPLIEIITLPHIHSPQTAAAVVRKIQAILQAVGANATGMEMGGLRADVNVSVRPREGTSAAAVFEYDGVTGLGQRTEIKNLSSIKAVEDAIIAERDRQISVLEAGGVIEGETRGWTLGSTETRRLRGKEGEVDYRYMPDPDLGPVRIGSDLVERLRETLPVLPDQSLDELVHDAQFRLSMKDARTLISLDDGRRLDFYYDVVDLVRADLAPESDAWNRAAKMVANWVLMDLPTHLTATDLSFPYNVPPPTTTEDLHLSSYTLAAILTHLARDDITTPTARHLLTLLPTLANPQSQADPPDLALPNPATTPISALIDAHNLRLHPLTDAEYDALASTIVAENEQLAAEARAAVTRTGFARARGKVMWFVGRMVRAPGVEGRVQPARAEGAVRKVLGV